VITEIITHEYPDLDAILSILLLKRFGESILPGVSQAKVSFCPASDRPRGKSTDTLEKEGVLAVDIGGGRFDNHPVGNRQNVNRRNRCAADLVAEELGLTQDPLWKDLIEYTRLHDTNARSIQSSDYIHHVPTVPTIITGLSILYRNDSDISWKILRDGMEIIEAIPAYLSRKPDDFQTEVDHLIALTDRYLAERGIDSANPPQHYKNFAVWRSRLDESPRNAFSRDRLDRLISLSTLSAGFRVQYDNDQERIWQCMKRCFDAIIAREQRWVDALNDVDLHGQFETVRNTIHVAAVESENGLVIKACRKRGRVDLVVYRDPVTGSTSLILNRRGPLKRFSMSNLAAKIRIAECMETNTVPDHKALLRIGKTHGWFLHQSKNLLICGSLKSRAVMPSKISMENILQIVRSEIDWQQSFPERYCPVDNCRFQKCPLYAFNFMSCRNRRRRDDESKQPSGTN
jgi:hypothetical protein